MNYELETLKYKFEHLERKVFALECELKKSIQKAIENSERALNRHRFATGKCPECNGTGNASIEKDTAFIPCIFCGGDGKF